MRFATLASAAAVAVSGVAASPVTIFGFDLTGVIGFDLTQTNHYGSPLPPWHPQGKPGWYFGNSPHLYPEIPCLSGIICKILDYFPYAIHCPHPPPPPPPPPANDGYTQTFSNITGATQADDFQTFGLVDTVAGEQTERPAYHDVNGKGGSTQLTCSLFTKCHDASTADNRGGQSQPDGSIDFIINSDGWCKNGVPISDPN
uniref:Uncharacterized protein n=1 Tax=Psilocybe cubensis TaxID=181762 RepID=A0A8H8CEQ0_PSICU